MSNKFKTNWTAIVCAYAAGIFAAASAAKVGPMLPTLRDQFGLTMVAAGWLSSLSSVMSACAALLFGIIAAHTGALRFAFAGLLALAIGNLLGALAEGPWVLFGGRFVEGLGFMAMIVSIPALIASAATPADRTRALAFWGLHVTLGSALGICSAILLLEERNAWRVQWIFFTQAALLTLLAMLIFAWRAESEPPPAHKGTRSAPVSVRDAIARPGPWLLGLVLIMQGAQFSTIIVWLPSYLREAMALSGSSSTIATALFLVIAALGSVFAGARMRASTDRGVILLVSLPTAGLLFCAVMTDTLPPWLRVAGVVAAGLAYGTTATVAISGATHYARTSAEVGILQGVLAQTVHIGMSVGPPLAAAFVSYSADWGSVRWMVLGAVTLGMIGAAAMVRDDRRRGATTTPKDLPLRVNW